MDKFLSICINFLWFGEGLKVLSDTQQVKKIEFWQLISKGGGVRTYLHLKRLKISVDLAINCMKP